MPDTNEPTILLVDDDDAIRTGLASALRRARFHVLEGRDGREALRLVEGNEPDVIVLDIMMPAMDGREVLRRLRQAGNWTPVIMLTQIMATGEKIASLEEGADDYLNKPFDSYELIARLRALLRRQAVAGRPAHLANVLISGSLRLERETQRVWREGQEIPLSNKAFGVLAHLMGRPSVVVSREQLLDQVWGWEDPAGMRTVDVRIAEIRRKLGDEALIETVPGEGYRFAGSVKVGEAPTRERLMTRRLGIAGLALLAAGVLAAGAARLLLPPAVLQFGFQADPAVALLVAGLVLALAVLAAAVLARWQQRRERRALADQAGAQEVERRRFIQRLDHELKNPLTAIQVHLDNLQENQSAGALTELGQARTAEAVSDVRAQVGRLSGLTRGLRRLADLETRALEIETVDVEELLDEVIDLLESPGRIQLDVQRVPWAIPSIQADRELLLMVLRNLVDNALKYSGDPVQVRARHTAGHLVVEVIDTGRGIPDAELPLVTEELYRGSNTHDVSGSGLGLSIVQRILERHGGRLEVRSRVGQGTIATVTLPYDQAAPR